MANCTTQRFIQYMVPVVKFTQGLLCSVKSALQSCALLCCPCCYRCDIMTYIDGGECLPEPCTTPPICPVIECILCNATVEFDKLTGDWQVSFQFCNDTPTFVIPHPGVCIIIPYDLTACGDNLLDSDDVCVTSSTPVGSEIPGTIDYTYCIPGGVYSFGTIFTFFGKSNFSEVCCPCNCIYKFSIFLNAPGEFVPQILLLDVKTPPCLANDPNPDCMCCPGANEGES